MILDDLFDNSDQNSSPVAGSTPAPQEMLQQLLTRSKEVDARLAALKAKPAPTLSEAPKDELEPLSNDLLRGFFKSSMPPTGQPQPQDNFGDQFRQSISPGREVLANVLNGVSASFMGTKFRTVREQAMEQYTTEQKLGLERQQLQRQAMQSAATLAQRQIENQAENVLKRDVEAVRTAEKQDDKEIAVLKLQQSAQQFQQKYGLDVASLLQKITHETADENKINDKFYQDARAQASGLFQKQGLDPNAKENAAAFAQLVSDRAHQLRLRDLQDQAANKPDPATKTPTPALAYVPDGNGGFRVVTAAPGSTLPPGAVTGQGMNAESVPTSATRAMAEKAPRVLDFADRIGQLLDENEKKLGPLKGQWAQFQAGKVGLKDKGMTQLRVDLGLLNTALMQMHVGARGGSEIMQHFKELISDARQDPDNLRAALGEVRAYAQRVQEEGHVGARNAPRESAPKPTHRFNPKTGMIEEIK